MRKGKGERGDVECILGGDKENVHGLLPGLHQCSTPRCTLSPFALRLCPFPLKPPRCLYPVEIKGFSIKAVADLEMAIAL
jgi:hypothetical protein